MALSITKRFPHHNFSWKVLAEIYKTIGRIPEALVAGQKAVEIDPQDAEAHSNLGVTQQEVGKLEEAKSSYTKAIALEPDFADAYNNLSVILRDEPLEFEKQLYDELFDHSCALEKLPPYIRLHDLLSRLWITLYQTGIYCNMVKPLELAD